MKNLPLLITVVSQSVKEVLLKIEKTCIHLTFKFWWLIILLVSSIVLGITLNHNPNLEFDEANTVRISQLPPLESIEVLRYEQNFPLYYIILHFVGKITSTDTDLLLFSYGIWLCCVIAFYVTARSVVNNEAYARVGTIIFSIIPNVVYYAYFIRMYGLIVLLTLLALRNLYFFSKNTTYKNPHLYGIFIFLSSISFLHPSAIAIIGLFYLSLIFLSPKTKIIYLFLITDVLIIAAHMLSKIDVLNTYLGQGILYIKLSPTFFYDTLGYLLNDNKNDFSVILYVSFFYIAIKWLMKAKHNKTYVIIYFSLSFFIILNILNVSFTASRHFLYLAPLIIITFLIGVMHATKTEKRIAFSVIFLFLITSLNYHIQQRITLDHYYNAFCQNTNKLVDTGGVIFSDWGTLNALHHCNPNLDVKMLGNKGIIETSKLTRKEQIIEQVKLGGLFWFRNVGDSNAMNQELESLNNYLQTYEHDKVVLVTWFLPRRYLNQYELNLFREYKYKEFLEPGTYVFERT